MEFDGKGRGALPFRQPLPKGGGMRRLSPETFHTKQQSNNVEI